MDIDNIDKTKFKIESYVKKIEKPWGFELHLTPDNLPYMYKILHVNAGKRASLQAHDKKQESWLLLNGDARLFLENSQGELQEIVMEKGVGYTCAIGQKHRIAAGDSDAEVVETSTPELGITFRLEDDFNRPDETEEMRKDPKRGWQG